MKKTKHVNGPGLVARQQAVIWCYIKFINLVRYKKNLCVV